MIRLAPLALAMRYLDMSQRWIELTPGTRDTALHNTESGEEEEECSTILLFNLLRKIGLFMSHGWKVILKQLRCFTWTQIVKTTVDCKKCCSLLQAT